MYKGNIIMHYSYIYTTEWQKVLHQLMRLGVNLVHSTEQYCSRELTSDFVWKRGHIVLISNDFDICFLFTADSEHWKRAIIKFVVKLISKPLKISKYHVSKQNLM